jgi:hypothetical protein
MSKEELIGKWMIQQQEANQRHHTARSELRLIADTFERLAEALRASDLTEAERLLATTTIPERGVIKGLITEANVSEVQAKRANQELINLGFKEM